MVHQLLAALLFPGYLLIRFTIHKLRDVIWWMNGTQKQILNNQLETNYGTSAHVQSIIGRGRFDQLIASNKVEDFITLHQQFVHPTYVLEDEVTLYHVNSDQAVFVECSRGDMPWDVSRYNFFKRGQFLTARRLVVMPLSSAERLAEQLGDSKGKLVVLPNMARCGSTLMCQVFDRTGRFRTFSEPGVLSDLMPWLGLTSYPWVQRLARVVVRLLCKPTAGSRDGTLEGFVIKPIASMTELITLLMELYPDASYILLYRDMEPLLRSIYRLYVYMPFSLIIANIPTFMQQALSKYYNANFCGDGGYFVKNGFRLKTLNARVAALPLMVYYTYFQWRKEGRPAVAVKFEDLVDDPEESLRRIFSRCDISLDNVQRALDAFGRDSQRETIGDKASFDALKAPPMGAKDLAEIARACSLWNLPDVTGQYTLPGTITSSGDGLE